jgi:hypothetical protein
MDFDFEYDPHGFLVLMITVIVITAIVLLSWHFLSWYSTTASNHTAMICIGRGVC